MSNGNSMCPSTACKMCIRDRVAKGVNRTAFDNGVVLYVNYNEAPVSVGDIRIEAKGFTRCLLYTSISKRYYGLVSQRKI